MAQKSPNEPRRSRRFEVLRDALIGVAHDPLSRPRDKRRWVMALALFGSALLGLSLGVSLTERPEVTDASLLTKAYYSLGLFVFGGLDIGTPQGGPLIGRVLLWVAYFGAPVLTASAVIEALARVLSPEHWQLRRISNHIVLVGVGGLTDSYLRVVRKHSPKKPVVVVDEHIDFIRQQELEQTFNVIAVKGDITHDFLLRALRLKHASKVILLGDRDFQSYEAASKIITRFPHLRTNVVLRCHRLRFMRAMNQTAIASQLISFNAYHLAAKGLVRERLITHFRKTQSQDTVVIAGFGRFGQSVLEELQENAENELSTVALIDMDADRRVLVAEEQQKIGGAYRKAVFQGDISHPEVWRRLEGSINLAVSSPTVILGTGNIEENLRTALWLKRKHPNAFVFARTNDISTLALEIGTEQDINYFSIKQLVEDNIPATWLN